MILAPVEKIRIVNGDHFFNTAGILRPRIVAFVLQYLGRGRKSGRRARLAEFQNAFFDFFGTERRRKRKSFSCRSPAMQGRKLDIHCHQEDKVFSDIDQNRDAWQQKSRNHPNVLTNESQIGNDDARGDKAAEHDDVNENSA